MVTKQDTLGVDIGGVVIARSNLPKVIAFFKEKYLESTAVDGAFDALRRLGSERFEGRVYLVSKCGKHTEERTRLWLAHHNFYALTAIPAEHVYYCRLRQDKAPLCEMLGVTHFVDDKLEVLSYLKSVEFQYLFDPVEKEVQKFADHLPSVRRVQTWNEILTELLP